MYIRTKITYVNPALISETNWDKLEAIQNITLLTVLDTITSEIQLSEIQYKYLQSKNR